MKKRGISLIVLIITIIVVIILASIIILSFKQNNPIKKAQEAKFKSEISQFKEELLMTHSNNLVENKKYKSEGVNVGAGNYGLMKAYIPSITEDYAKRLQIINGELFYVEESSSEFDEDESEWAYDIGVQTKGKVPREWSKYIDMIVDENVPVPKGFKYKEGTKATGVVIEDDKHNEFVWIPVDNVSDYKKETSLEEDLPTSIPNEAADVEKYHGFYIGRYEATTSSGQVDSRTDSVDVPTCIKGKVVWTNIGYSNMKLSAESMYSGANLSVQSGLLTGKAWDTTCYWLEDDIKKINSNSTLLNSLYYGNYYNALSPADVQGHGEKQVAGYSDKWKVKNIYDLAGNVFERTYEISTTSRVGRGGCYAEAMNYPISYRANTGDPSFAGDVIGFRVRLYIKTN